MTEHLPKEERDFRADAEKLCALVSDLQHKLLVKHTTAVLEEVHDQLAQRDAEITRLKKTVSTLIAWLQRELGGAAVGDLLAMLESQS